jgi:hypothetical protein
VFESYLILFILVVAAYVIYSAWARLDSRYLLLAVVVIPVVAAVEYGLGRTAEANTLADYFFIVLAGFIGLLVIDDVRGGWGPDAVIPVSTTLGARQRNLARPVDSAALDLEGDELE